MERKEIRVKDKENAGAKSELTYTGPVFLPAVDILEKDDAVILIADMPGVDSEGVDVHLNEKDLTISGQIKEEKYGNAHIHNEFQRGDYLRTFSLSQAIDGNRIEAIMKNGVLRIVLPKAETIKPRRIEVKAG